MSDYIEIIIDVENQHQKDLLIAKLSDIGFEGFEEGRTVLKAYILEPDFNEASTDSIVQSQSFEYTRSVVQQKNWNEEWEAGFEPVIVDSFCAIRASFHAPVTGVEHDIIITPKMSFGTGHHATTYLMIEALASIDVQNKKVIDFGTGTGVLAILAEKLGASLIEAIDNDEWSIENGRENIQMNDCRNIVLYKSDSLEAAAQADILLANINKNVIMQQLKSMKEHLLPGGSLFLSGLLSGDLEDIKRIVIEEGLSIKETKERSSWICIHIISI